MESGLSPETVEAAGVYSAGEPEVKNLLGFGGCGTGLVFPYDAVYCRVRIDRPGPDGRHYRAPQGSTNRLYLRGLRDNLDDVVRDTSIPLYITEGEKKALKANQDGYPTIGLAGVWSWKVKLHGKSLDIPDLDKIEWRKRRVILVFDSDAEQKPGVAWAEHQLAITLRSRGADVYVIRLPEGPRGEKQGWDDFLVAHGPEAFGKLEVVSVLDQEESAPTFLSVLDLAETYLSSVSAPTHRVRMGIPALDTEMRGMAEGEVLTILGRSGVGKTAFLLNLCQSMTGGQIPALIFSLEMQGPELFERMVSLDTGLGGSEIEAGARLNNQATLTHIRTTIRNWSSVVVVDRPCSLSQVNTLIAAAQATGRWSEPLRLVFIDYLGMLSPERHGKAYEIVSETARELKRVAKRNRVRVVILCQISREGEDGGVPVTMQMARDSGVIEESSDYILGIWRPELKAGLKTEERQLLRGELKARILKQRGGPAPITVNLRLNVPSLKIDTKGVRA